MKINREEAKGVSLQIFGKWDVDIYGLKNNLSDLGAVIDDSYISDEDAMELFSQKGVFILPYLNISQSGVFYAMIQSGCIPVCSDVGDFGNSLREFGLERLLFSTGAPREIFDCLQWIEDNKDETVARLNHFHNYLALGSGLRNILEENLRVVAVSILMPCYNSEAFVTTAVRSVQAQTFSDWELLICDDGSSDASLRVVKSLAECDDRLTVLKNNGPKGAAGARNTCLSKANGRYIAFLDSDDLWLPSKLEKQIQFMNDTKQPFVFGYCQNISEGGDRLSVTKAPERVSFFKILLSNFIPCLTVIYDTKKLGKVYQPNIKKRNDFALWLCILNDHRDVKARCFPEVVARYRVNSYGLSANKISGIKYFYRCLCQYAGLNKPTAGFCTFLALGFKGLKTLSPRMYNLVVTKLL